MFRHDTTTKAIRETSVRRVVGSITAGKKAAIQVIGFQYLSLNEPAEGCLKRSCQSNCSCKGFTLENAAQTIMSFSLEHTGILYLLLAQGVGEGLD